MLRRRIGPLGALALLLTGAAFVAPPAWAQSGVPAWVEIAPQNAAFDPLVPGVAHPAILVETNNYVFGPQTGFTTPM